MKTEYSAATPFVTKDGSVIRELMHPQLHAVKGMSIAEAIVEPGATTLLHQHRLTEEIYHITQGEGLMRLGVEEFMVGIGDTIVIPPGTAHNITNTGTAPLKILCACQPAYSHEDTELL
jgi:mannose-6-phosphate isomerase-like protein (cupin superfamily)